MCYDPVYFPPHIRVFRIQIPKLQTGSPLETVNVRQSNCERTTFLTLTVNCVVYTGLRDLKTENVTQFDHSHL